MSQHFKQTFYANKTKYNFTDLMTPLAGDELPVTSCERRRPDCTPYSDNSPHLFSWSWQSEVYRSAGPSTDLLQPETLHFLTQRPCT